MSNNSRIGLVTTVLVGLLVLAGAVMAAEVLIVDTDTEATTDTDTEADAETELEAEAEADTSFSFGYDQANQFLVVSVGSTDDEGDEAAGCEFEADPEDGRVLNYTAGEDAIEVSDLPEGCELHAIDVTGPAGQINHGMIMKAFNAHFDTLELEHGRGCLNRHLAHTDFGKGEQQVKAGEETEGDEGTELSELTGTVDFTTILTECERGSDDEIAGELETEDDGPGNGKGKGKNKGKGRPDSPGNSGSASGRRGR